MKLYYAVNCYLTLIHKSVDRNICLPYFQFSWPWWLYEKIFRHL